MEALKCLLLLFLWYERASAQTTEIRCSVTVIDDTVNITVNSNVSGTFRCIVDEQDLEICNSGDGFEDLSEGVHSITIQFTQNGSTPIDCLNQNFTISRSSSSFGFEVEFSYIGNVIILMITPSSDGVFCCQLDRGICIRCESGFQFTNVPSGSHTITVQGASLTSPQLSESITLQVPEFTVAADVIGSTITLLIGPDADAEFRCRLDDNDPVACSNGSQFRGVSAGQHIIEVEKIDGAERATASVTVTVSERVVSFMNLLVSDVDQTAQNYTFTFTLTGETSDVELNVFIDSNSSVSHNCGRIFGTNYSCSLLLNSGVTLGYHNITIQALLNNTVYGEITQRFFVFRDSTIKFKDSSYIVKEDDETYTVTIQKFGLTTERILMSVRTRASNPTSAIPSTDYPTTPGTVIFEAGSTSEMSVVLRVEPDDVFEANETFVLTLFVPISIRRRQNLVLMDERPVVTIVNDDSVTVNLQLQVDAVTEGGTNIVNISVEPINLMANIFVIVETYFCGGCNGADPETDYIPVNQTVILGPGNTVELITINVLEDIFTESNDEVVCVRIILPERSQVPGVLLSVSDTNFTIIDTNDNSLNLSLNATSMRNQTDTRYTISVNYNAVQQATIFNCRLNDQAFLPCNLPQVYTNLPYDVHTVTVQALSDSSNVTIVQKVLMVMAEVSIINGTAVLLHIQSTLPATYRCWFGENFPCNDQQVISGLSRGNYTLTVEAISADNNALTAFEDFAPVFLFGSNVTEGQSAAVMCSGSFSNLLDVNYTASWRARGDRIDFVLTANTSQKWLGIGFTDKQMTKYDLIVGATDNNGTYFVDDRNFIGREPVLRDSEQNIEDASVLFDNGTTIVRFSRQRDTGDEDDFSLSVCRYFLFAFGEVIDIRMGEIDIGQRSPSDVVIKQRFDVEEPICIPTSSSLCPEVFDCGDPGEPLNGTVQVVGNNLEGSIASYDCNEGHLLIGENQRTCTSSDSIWTGAVPECQFVDCGHPGTPSNGSSDFNSTILNASVRHSCDSGYVLCDGNATRTCQPNMSWSGTILQCIRVTVTLNDTVRYEVEETDGVVNIMLIFDQPSCQPVTIVANPRVRSIPDATVEDFNDTAVMVTIAPGDTTATVPISIINDDLLESPEVFEVAIEIGGMDTDGAVVGQLGVAEVTIISEDVVMVMFAESEYNESEGAGSMRIGVQLSRILQQMITIQIVTTPITAEGNGIDFDSTIRNVTFMAGNESSFVSIPIIDNNAVENIENFSLSIQISPALADIGVMLGAPSMATGFIVDDDVDCGRLDSPENGLVDFDETFGGSVANYSCNETFVLCGTESRTCQSNGSWSGSSPDCIRVIISVDDSNSYRLFENLGSIDIVLLLDQPSCRPITIIANPQERSPPSATVNDFNDTSVIVIVDSGETQATASISILDDDLLEPTEFFDVVFSIGGTDTAGAIIRDPGIAEVIISNDDIVVVMFTEREFNASEGAGMMSIGFELNRETPQNITLQLIVIPITAEGDNIDIDSESRNITFERGIRTLGVNISINDDDILEPVESVRFVLQVLQEFRDIGVRIGFISEAIGNIIDNEVVMVMFAESEYNESEGAGSMRIEVQLSRILQQMITIQIVTTPITAEGNGIDFDSTIRNVTFMAGNDSSFVSIPIIDNNAVENIENFSLSIQISPALADIGVMLGTPSMATGFIVDDDVDCGNLEDPDNGQVNFAETFGGSVANYSCDQEFVLCGTESRTCQSNGSWSGSSPDCIRVIISVDDSNSYRLFENLGSIDIFLLLDQPSCRPITIIANPQERSPPSATVNDFNDTSVIVIVDPGETQATASISILDDDLLEPTEFFDVVFSIGGTDTAGAIIRDPGIAEVIISNDDIVVVMFTEREFNASEGAGMMSIGVELNRETPQNITLQLIVIPITAEGDNIDIDSESRNITFERGIRTLGVNISINDDDILEPVESVRFVLQVLQEFRDIGVRIGFISEAIGNIIDDEVVMVMFAESEYNESEGAGSMRIEVQLSRILQQMITIQIVTTPITAEGNGIDFDSTIRNVTFMAGNDSSFVSIPIIDNNAVENIENFSLSIQISPALADIGVMLGTPSMATGFIVDDDVDCGNLEDPDNGQVNFVETFGGSVANYSCDQEFVLCGTESRTCQSNGSWSGSSPNCTRVIISVDDSNSYRLFENLGSIDIVLLLDQPSCRPITIIANPQERSPPSATVNDFNDTSVIVIVDPGETQATASISILDDDLLEPTEFFDVVFSIGGTDTAGAVIRDPGIAEVIISNDDIVVVMFTEREFNASEGAGMMSIGVELSRETPQNITLQLIVIPITAEGDNIDIDSESRNITFEHGIRTLGVNISINDDDIFEPVESVRFVLQVLQEFRDIGVRIGFISEAIGNIIDDEADCGEPESPINGMVSFNSTVEGSIANYTCDEGYLLEGVTQRSCNEGDQWSGNVPECLIVQCGAPPIPTNGMVVVSSETFGSTIAHTCNTGFLLCGDINRTCQSNGSWSGSTPDCISVIVTVEESAFTNENSGAADIMVFIDQPSCLPITIIARPQVRAIPDATESDFDNSTVIKIIDPGDTRTTLSIPIFNDDLLESTELFNVFIEVGANDTNYVTVAPPGLSQVSIITDDLISAGFTANEYTATEREGVMTVGIELNMPSPQEIILLLDITPNTAEGNGVDFDSQSRDVIFERGSIREFVNISINDDNMVEPRESFRLLLPYLNEFRAIGIFIGLDGQATGFIIDDDVDCGSLDDPPNGQVELTSGGSVANYTCDQRYVLCGMDSRICQSNGSWSGSPPQCIRAVVRVDNSIDYTINENSSSVNITVLLDQPSCRMITITATPQIRSPPSARGNDFDNTEVTVTINPGETSIMIPIGITDDNLLEDTEYFDVRITTSSNIGAVVRAPRVAEVGIISDDVVTVNFTRSEYFVNENAGVILVGVRLSREPLQRIAVQVVFTGNSAEGNGIDFNSNTINVNFQRRAVMRNVSIPIVNDDTVEATENFSLSFQILTQFSNIGVRQGIPATATVFIIDDDVDCGDPGQPANGSVNFTTTREEGVANYTCNEGFILIGVTQRICQANSSWSGDVPTCQIVDCEMPGIPANGISDVTTTTLGSVARHSCLEGFLLCGVGSRTCQANGMWSESLPNCTTVTVTLDNTAYIVSEDDGFVEIELRLDQPSCVPIDVVIQPRIRTLGDPVNIASTNDFNINSTVAVFNPGETETVTFISVENDLVLEQNELFDIGLLNINIPGVKVGMPRTAIVSIVNSNMLTVAFSQELYSVNESEGEVTIGLELGRPAGRSVTIRIRAMPNTAEGNNLDFDSMSRTVTFGPDDTLRFLNVFINNDAEVELEENFTLSILPSRAATRIGVRLGDPSETTVIINDDDEVIPVEFEQSSYRVNEKAENIEICLLSSGQNNADIFVRVQPQETIPASARASSDFVNTVSSVQFGPGEIISCYNQTIIDNTVPENFETFDVVILPDSIITIGNQSTSQIIIIDDDVKANDTIIEDPVYTVPLQISPEMLANNPDVANLSLCYEIHGSANSFFNLVSDQCVSITAEYRQSVNNSRFNFIGKIGVLAVDNDGDCQHITVDGDGCVASVGSTAVTGAAPYNRSGVRVRMNRRYYRIAVPNCELQDLVVWAICEERNTLKFVITRGFNLQPTSHGLVAQFWNIPVELSSFTGQTPNNETGYYTVKVTPADGDVREFIGSLYPLTWDYTETPCLYAGNQQGGNAIEFEGFSDSVIEGFYWQYAVDSLFDTEFVFSQFNNSQCIP